MPTHPALLDVSAPSVPPRVPPAERRRLAALRHHAWRLAGIAILAWTLVVGWPHVGQAVETLRRADAAPLLTAMLFQAAALVMLSLAYRAALASVGGRVSFRQAGGTALRAATVSRLLPGGGAAAVVFAIRRLRTEGVPDGPAGAGVAIHGIVTMGSLAVLVAILGTTSLLPSSTGRLAAATIVTVAALGTRRWRPRTVLAAAAQRLPDRPSFAVLRAMAETLAAGPLRGRCLLSAMTFALAAWMLELAALWSAVAAVGHLLPAGTVALGLGAAHAAAAVPHTPGGVGVVEAAMTGAYVTAGLDAEVALAGVLAYRVVGFWLPVALGGALLGRDAVGRRRRVRAEVRTVAA